MKTELNIPKFDLIKNIFFLNKQNKINLIKNWENNLKKASIADTLEKESRLYDPETSDHLIEILDLLEKFLKVDEDISFKNICLFTSPMYNGSKKIILRPYKIIGLINNLTNLSKKFEKEYSKNKKITPELKEIKRNFQDNLSEVRKRLMSLDNEIITKKKSPKDHPEFSEDKDIENNLQLKIKNIKTKNASKNYQENLASTIDFYSKRLQGMSVSAAKNVLNQIKTNYGENFDKEIRKEILKKIK